MQTSGGVDDNYVSSIGFCALQGVECHACRVRAHLLLYHWHSNTVAPNLYLLDSRGAEGVGGSEIYLLSCFLELVSELSDCCSLAHAVHANNKYDIRFMVGWQVPIGIVVRVVFREQ